MPDKQSSSNQQRIYIIGAGAGGLYTAISLIQRGIPAQRLGLVDHRAGSYTRPGHISGETLRLVVENTEMLSNNNNNNNNNLDDVMSKEFSTACHIKELERYMYRFLVNAGVTFIQEKYIDLQVAVNDTPCGIVTETEHQEKRVYPSAYVFDCTGSKGVVADSFNKITNLTVFEKHPLIKTNPIPRHVIAHVKVPKIDTYIRPELESSAAFPSSIKYDGPGELLDLLEELRLYGWMHPAFPTFTYFDQKEGSDKVCLYMEAPDDLPEEKIRGWIKCLLSLYSNDRIKDFQQLKPSEKYAESKDDVRIITFSNHPHCLSQVVAAEPNLPTLIVGFDALKGFEYRRGHGVLSGIRCLQVTLDHINISDGMITSIDVDKINKEVLTFIQGEHAASVEDYAKERQLALVEGHEHLIGEYLFLASSMSENPHAQLICRQQLTVLSLSLAKIYWHEQLRYEGQPCHQLYMLGHYMELILNALQWVSSSETELSHTIASDLLQSIQLSSRLIRQLSIDDLVDFADDAIEILENTLPQLKTVYRHLDGNFAQNITLANIDKLIDKIHSNQQIPFFCEHGEMTFFNLGIHSQPQTIHASQNFVQP